MAMGKLMVEFLVGMALMAKDVAVDQGCLAVVVQAADFLEAAVQVASVHLAVETSAAVVLAVMAAATRVVALQATAGVAVQGALAMQVELLPASKVAVQAVMVASMGTCQLVVEVCSLYKSVGS